MGQRRSKRVGIWGNMKGFGKGAKKAGRARKGKGLGNMGQWKGQISEE